MNDYRRAIPLMVRTGLLLGLMLATVNWARTAGWGSLAFTLAPILLAGAVTGLGLLGRVDPGFWQWRFWGYSGISGALGMVIPNWLVFLTMARDGVITAAVFYLLSPIFTQALTWVLRIDRLAPLRVAGILLGAAGAMTLVLAPMFRSGTGVDADVPLVGLLIPLSLAVGNIYRKRRMPLEMSSVALAAGMLLASGLLFIPLFALAWALGWPGSSVGGVAPLLAQSVLMGFGFVSYFQFLRQVDPVYFSQLGYLVTLTGGLAGIVFFGESPAWRHAISLALVALGVWLVSRQTPSTH